MEKYGHFKNQGRLKIKINELQIDENVQQSSTNNSLEPKKKKNSPNNSWIWFSSYEIDELEFASSSSSEFELGTQSEKERIKPCNCLEKCDCKSVNVFTREQSLILEFVEKIDDPKIKGEYLTKFKQSIDSCEKTHPQSFT